MDTLKCAKIQFHTYAEKQGWLLLYYRYAEHVLKSAGSVAQSNFPRNINSGIKEN
jgi:hypothetical protein